MTSSPMPSQRTAGQAMHSWFSKHPGVVVEVGRRSESDRDERKHKEPCLGLGLWLPDFPHTHRSLGARSLQLPGCASFRSSNDARAAGEIPPCKGLSVQRCSAQSAAVATLPPSRTGWEAAQWCLGALVGESSCCKAASAAGEPARTPLLSTLSSR